MEYLIFSIQPLLRLFGFVTISFLLAMAWTPLLTDILYRYKARKTIRTGSTPIFSRLHKSKAGVLTMGGLLVIITTTVITLLFNLSRSQTWLPLFTLLATGALGFFDDILNIRGTDNGKGMRARYKLIWQIAIAAVGAWWFYSKLGWGIHFGIHIPGDGDFLIGLWYIPLFIFVLVASMNAVNITDGLDGLAAGLLSIAFLVFGGLAFFGGQYGLAAFCGTIAGSLLAFLWFNIYPARFFMGDTGSMALGATLGVVAMLTNNSLALPIIAFVFVIETLSVILQIFWRFVFKKKLLLSAPLHHHLEAKGWPETKVTMRLWVIGAIFAIIGFLIGLIGKG